MKSRRSAVSAWLAGVCLAAFAWPVLAAQPCADASGGACREASSEPARSPLHFRKEAAAEGSRQLLAPYEILAGLALAGAAAYWLRRRYLQGGRIAGAEDGVRVVGKCRLSVKTTIYVIHHRDREIVLAEHEHGVTAIRDDLKP